MSLLLFFSHPSPVFQDINLSPSVIYSVDTQSPVLQLVQEALGEFQVSTITYSSLTETYNSSSLYGGADRVRPVLMTLQSIDSVEQTLYDIGRI